MTHDVTTTFIQHPLDGGALLSGNEEELPGISELPGVVGDLCSCIQMIEVP